MNKPLIRTALVATLVVLSAGSAMAQETLTSARDLYSSAAYEDALVVLDRLSAANNQNTDRFAINQYRAFCFLALGRTTEAERAIETLVSDRPLYHPTDAEASPRLRSAFSTVRQRMLPTIVQQKYAQAKLAYDSKDFIAATSGFTEVLQALSDPDLGAAAGRPPLSDMGTLAAGFKELSAQAVAMQQAIAAQQAAAQAAADAAQAKAALEQQQRAASAPPPPPRIFNANDATVIGPSIIRQDLPSFPRNIGSMVDGVLEIQISETGIVEQAVMRMSANPRYDTMVLAATKNWHYKPAMVGGVPVKFKKVINISLKAGND